jgi:hypothetical protein
LDGLGDVRIEGQVSFQVGTRQTARQIIRLRVQLKSLSQTRTSLIGHQTSREPKRAHWMLNGLSVHAQADFAVCSRCAEACSGILTLWTGKCGRCLNLITKRNVKDCTRGGSLGALQRRVT